VAELDLRDVLATSDVTIAPSEREDERAVRLAGEKRAKLLEDIKGTVIFFVVLVVILVIAGFCVHTIFFSKTTNPDTQMWARTALTALLSGGVSFLFGRAIAAK
jgi:hypothetical protein